MDSGLQIDNVQSFVEVIGNNDNLWNFLVGREVINFWGIRGRIVLLCDRLTEDEIWKKIKLRVIDRFTKVVEGFIQRCRKLSLTSEKLWDVF